MFGGEGWSWLGGADHSRKASLASSFPGAIVWSSKPLARPSGCFHETLYLSNTLKFGVRVYGEDKK